MAIITAIVDDDELICKSLKTILENDGNIQVAAIGKNGDDAVEIYHKVNPDVILLDIRMKPKNGIEAGEIILQSDKKAKILFLTTFSDDEYIVKALNMGACGYILKQDFKSIPLAVKAAAGGQNVFGSKIVSKFTKLVKIEEKFDINDYQINGKEMEIIRLIAQGKSNKEISEQLFLSEGTVKNYLSIILEKLNLKNRTQLAIFYLNGGFY